MRKDRILERDHKDYVRAERDVLTAVVHPYIVTLRYSFQASMPVCACMRRSAGAHCCPAQRSSARSSSRWCMWHAADWGAANWRVLPIHERVLVLCANL